MTRYRGWLAFPIFLMAGANWLGAQAPPLAGSVQPNLSDAASSAEPVAELSGTAMDTNGDELPNATVVLDGPTPADHRSITADDNGYFLFAGLRPGPHDSVRISANGFAEWRSPDLTLIPGQYLDLTGIKLQLPAALSSVTVYARNQELAVQQVQIALDQRILGVFPNFFVVYDSQHAVPLPVKEKFRLSFRATTDPLAFVGAGFIAATSQMAHSPSYPLGAKGYAQRFGATYLDDSIDILFGGAVLPSLLHQDPRYYYQGTGSNSSRFWHAVKSPFVCMGDNGKLQPNYSTIGGDVIAAAANLYYPKADRGPQLILTNLMVGTLERTASMLAQEFLLRRFTSRSH